MDVLPTDLLVEIFLRLPATTLVTSLRHVCRSWHGIISDPIFIINHLERSIDDDEDNTTLLFQRDVRGHSKALFMYSSAGEELTFSEPKGKLPKMEIYDSTTLVCHGLVLYVHKNLNFIKMELCNPVLNQCISLKPITPATYGRKRSFGFGKGYDSVRDQFRYWACGFGFDPIKKQYKVVVISRTPDRKVRTSDVYCSTVDVVPEKKTISPWKKLGSLNYTVDYHCDGGVFVNGRLNWLLFETTTDGKYTDRDLILSMDLNTEELSFFPRINHPPVLYSEHRFQHIRLGVFGGTKLCMYVTDRYYFMGDGGTTVFVMEDYENAVSWKKYCYFFKNKRFEYYDCESVCYWKKGSFLFLVAIDSDHYNYVIVDNDMNKIGDSIDHARADLQDLFFISTFVPCLVSLLPCGN